MESTFVNRHSNGFKLSVTVAVVLVLLSSFLIALRVEQVLLDLTQAQALRTGQKTVSSIEHGFQLGLGLYDQSNLERQLKALGTDDASQQLALLLNEQRQPVLQVGDARWVEKVNPVWTAQLLGQHGSQVSSISRVLGDVAFNGVAITDTAGHAVGVLWLLHDRSPVRAEGTRLMWALAPYALLAMGVLSALLAGLSNAWMRYQRRRIDRASTVLADAGAVPAPQAVIAAVDGDRALARQHRWAIGWDLAALGVAVLCSVLVLSGLVMVARDLARPLLLAQIETNTADLARSSAGRVSSALELGIPVDRLVGVEAAFLQELKSAPEVAFLSLQRVSKSEGAALMAVQPDLPPSLRDAARAAVQASTPNGMVASDTFKLALAPFEGGGVLAGTPLSYVESSKAAILTDLLFAVVVTVVLIRELFARAWDQSLLKPLIAFDGVWQRWRHRVVQKQGEAAAVWVSDLRQAVTDLIEQISSRAQGAPVRGVDFELVSIRLIVFFAALSEELMRPFFAVFAAEVDPWALGLSPTMLVGLPVAVFMLTLAVAQPLGPWIVARVDVRRALWVCAVAGALLLLATALNRDGFWLVVLRAGSGVTYGLLLILAQTVIVRITNPSQRARGLVEVSAAIVAAGVCGPALGGLIAERTGHSVALLASAVCLLLSGVGSLFLAPLPTDPVVPVQSARGWAAMGLVFRQQRVMAVTWFAAVPARLAAAALLVVVTPLYLLEIGEPVTISGRVLLLYFLCFMLAAPLAAHWSDLSRRRKPWIIWGCALSAVACLAWPLISGVWGAAVCCGLLGVAQALLSAPQLALVTEAFHQPPQQPQTQTVTPEQALAAFRLIERFGSIAAPFVVVLAVTQLGLTGAVGAIGLLLAAGTVGVWMGLKGYQDAVDLRVGDVS